MNEKQGVWMKKKLIAASAVAGLALSLGTAGVASAHDHRGGKGEKITTVLGDLVTSGTLTQAQADAITKAMTSARDAAKAAHDAARAEHVKVITDTLGIDEATLKSRVKAGESLATIAGAKKDALITALVAFETKKIDAAVAAGKITSEKATALKSGLTSRVTEKVESTRGSDKEMGKGDRDRHNFKGKGHGRGGR
jgi:Spy/CpxP family protein refolding chaperone